MSDIDQLQLEEARDSNNSINQCYSPSKLTSENNATISAGENVLILGATGLTGSKILKSVARLVEPDTQIYVLARTVFNINKSRPNIIIKICEPATWPEEISKIPNLKTVYSALGARPYHRFLNHFTPSNDDFYLVEHNLSYQVAVAARDAGASTFVYISRQDVSYPIPKFFFRRTIMSAAAERDLRLLNFPHLVLIRPGPLVGIRAKTGSFKMFSIYSIIDGIVIISLTPFIIGSLIQPLNTFNFAASVGKASVMIANDDVNCPVRVVTPWEINFQATLYDRLLSSQIFEGFRTVFANETTYEEVEKTVANVYKLLLGERLPLYDNQL